jgi:hypothetical protein
MSEHEPPSWPHELLQRRWYDNQPELSRSLHLSKVVPIDMLQIVGNGLVSLAEQVGLSHDWMNRRSLGPEKVLGVHKSKNRRRHYDRVASLHKGMSYHFLMPQEKQWLMGRHLRHMLDTVHDYCETCFRYRERPSAEHVKALTQTYMEHGPEEVQRYLWSLKVLLHRKAATHQGRIIVDDKVIGRRTDTSHSETER